MAKKLYVGNLPFSITEAAINEMFGQLGAVSSVRLIIDRQTGRSKGFGFVEMSDDGEAQSAISSLNGMQMEGRQILVNEARPLEPRENTRGHRGGFGKKPAARSGYGHPRRAH